MKTCENAAVLDFLAVDTFDFTRKIVKKSSRCPKLDGYAIANFGVRVEREVVKMIHYGWSSGEMKWSSEWLSGLMG